jgi:hypothetical protein
MLFEIKRIQNPAEWSAFFQLPATLYQKEESWVPPLPFQVKKDLDVERSPFFRHARMLPLLALDQNGNAIARAIGFIDERFNALQAERVAFFGFLDCSPKPGVAEALLAKVETWAKEKGMEILCGPANLFYPREAGLLIEGFSRPPIFGLSFHPRFLSAFVEKAGFKKERDLLTYRLPADQGLSERSNIQFEAERQRAGVTFRSLSLKNLDQEWELFEKIRSDASESWDLPLPGGMEELKEFFREWSWALEPGLCVILEVRGYAAGFALAIPDWNAVLEKVRAELIAQKRDRREARLMGTVWMLKAVWHLKGPLRKKALKRVRVMKLEMKSEYHHFDLRSLLMVETLKRAAALGYTEVEVSQVSENLSAVRKALEGLGALPDKVYRLYKKQL